eukprot:scaffold201740_cov31-Tisochrysis_lutea.AAC.3
MRLDDAIGSGLTVVIRRRARLHSTRHDSLEGGRSANVGAAAKHGVRLAGACLAIHKHAAIDAIEKVADAETGTRSVHLEGRGRARSGAEGAKKNGDWRGCIVSRAVPGQTRLTVQLGQVKRRAPLSEMRCLGRQLKS